MPWFKNRYEQDFTLFKKTQNIYFCLHYRRLCKMRIIKYRYVNEPFACKKDGLIYPGILFMEVI